MSRENRRRLAGITRAPVALANCVSSAPRKPIPTIATVSDLLIWLRRKMFIAQPIGSPGKGCSLRPSGIFTADDDSQTSYSAYALVERIATRSFFWKSVTSRPISFTRPHASCPNAPGDIGYLNHGLPSHGGRFDAHTPQPSIRTRI